MVSKKNNNSAKSRRAKTGMSTGKRNGIRRSYNTRIAEPFRIKLKHVLAGITFLGLLAAFEVFSIPASNGIIDLLGLTNFMAGMTWTFVAFFSGGAAIVLHEEEY